MYDLGSRLRDMRNKRGLTQKMLAERINKSVAAISGYETNAQTPPTDVLISISETLHVPITYFVDLNCKEAYSTTIFAGSLFSVDGDLHTNRERWSKADIDMAIMHVKFEPCLSCYGHLLAWKANINNLILDYPLVTI